VEAPNYQAQASRYIRDDGKYCGSYRVIDVTKMLTVLTESDELLPGEDGRGDFNPVQWFHNHGWNIDTPYSEWSSDGQGGRYTHDVKPAG
jgi:hypothetical protein